MMEEGHEYSPFNNAEGVPAIRGNTRGKKHNTLNSFLRAYFHLQVPWYFYLPPLLALFAIIIGLSIGLSAKSQAEHSPPTSVTVYYAGSLVDIMTRVIAPGLLTSKNLVINGTAAGSDLLASRLVAGQAADIFISAAISINYYLLNTTVSSSSTPVSTWFYPWGGSRLGTKSSFMLRSFLKTFIRKNLFYIGRYCL